MFEESVARALVLVFQIYVGLGLVVAVPFVVRGVGKIDPSAREGTRGFRLLILPGCVAFWPLIAWRWLRGAPPPEERNAHRRAARGRGAGAEA